jgi:hypothetical protein
MTFANDEIERAWNKANEAERGAPSSSWRLTWGRDLGSVTMQSGTFFGFGYFASTTDSTRRIIMPGVKWQRTVIQVPHWFLIVLTGLGPGYWFFRREKNRRARMAQGLCRKCGFMMGDVYHSCPKCGERAPLPDGFSVIETS